MIKFNKPENLNGADLINELKIAGVKISESPMVDAENFLWLAIDEKDKEKAESIVELHNGTIVAPDFVAKKTALLEKLGITEEEAQLLLS